MALKILDPGCLIEIDSSDGGGAGPVPISIRQCVDRK